MNFQAVRWQGARRLALKLRCRTSDMFFVPPPGQAFLLLLRSE
jgi:hypothetical protein